VPGRPHSSVTVTGVPRFLQLRKYMVESLVVVLTLGTAMKTECKIEQKRETSIPQCA